MNKKPVTDSYQYRNYELQTVIEDFKDDINESVNLGHDCTEPVIEMAAYLLKHIDLMDKRLNDYAVRLDNSARESYRRAERLQAMENRLDNACKTILALKNETDGKKKKKKKKKNPADGKQL